MIKNHCNLTFKVTALTLFSLYCVNYIWEVQLMVHYQHSAINSILKRSLARINLPGPFYLGACRLYKRQQEA